MNIRIILVRFITLGAFVCGVLGLVVGLIEREWRLGVTGWFMAGTLLAVLALVVLADEYFASRRQADG